MDCSTFFNFEAETKSVDQLRAQQNEKLKRLVRRLYDSNPIWRDRFKEAGVDPISFGGLDEISEMPMMGKEDFRNNYPLGLLAVEKSSLIEMHMSTGSTGEPIVMPYTKLDLDQWAQCMARCYRMAGAKKGDVVEITPSFGLFNGGFGMYHGARAAGLFTIPSGPESASRQIKLAKDFNARIITGVVSCGARILERLKDSDQTLDSVEIGIFGAEIISQSMKQKLSAGLGAEMFDIYGMTETGGVGTLGMDCQAHEGLHFWEDYYYAELLDPKTCRPVEDGQIGELVVTALTLEALPVVRFRTGDLTRVVSREKCACGRTHMRIGPITGRVDDMLIVKGVNFYPSQIEQILMEIPGVKPHYQIIIEDRDGLKELRVHVEAEESVTNLMIEKQLRETLGFFSTGQVFPPGKLPRQEGKAQRVFWVNASAESQI